jgi:hypothetical protein
MTSALTKPVESLTREDLESIIGWPEGLRLEFKRDLPASKGSRFLAYRRQHRG